jgi:hypothetical protein
MNWRKFVLCFSLLVILGGVAVGSFNIPTGPSYRNPRPDVLHIRIELVEPGRSEDIIKHFVGLNGADVEQEITYESGEVGHKYFREDGTLKEFKAQFTDGSVRMHAFYHTDGKLILNGFRLRDDRTTMWKAQQRADGIVVTSTFWYDGKMLFAEELRDPKVEQITTSYFRKGGSLWVKQVNDLKDLNVPTSEEVMDASGNIVYTVNLTEDGYTVTHYANGEPSFKQTFARNPMSAKSSVPPMAFKSVEVYGPDGETVTRLIECYYNGNPKTDTVFNEDETYTVTTVDYFGRITSTTVMAGDGETVLDKKENKENNQPKWKLDDGRLGTTEPGAPVDTYKLWREQEVYPHLRNLDAN